MPIAKIVKRDGRTVDFDAARIRDAVYKAFIAVELHDGEKAASVTDEVVRLLEDPHLHHLNRGELFEHR